MKRTPVDKSVLAFGIPRRVRDPDYLDSAKGRLCEVNVEHDQETVCACHVSFHGSGGMGIKPDDRLVFFLCAACHDEFDGRTPGLQGADFIVANIVVPWLMKRHEGWRAMRDEIEGMQQDLGGLDL